MTFNWSEYLNLAKELAGQSTTLAKQEARLRDAISRAYYAAFILARNHLRDKEGYSIPKTGDAHAYVREQFKLNPDPIHQVIADRLIRLRTYRNQADYVDKFPGLAGITKIAIQLADEVVSSINAL